MEGKKDSLHIKQTTRRARGAALRQMICNAWPFVGILQHCPARISASGIYIECENACAQ